MTLSRRSFLAAVAMLLGMPATDVAPCNASSKPKLVTISCVVGTPPQRCTFTMPPIDCTGFDRAILRWRDANDVWHSSAVDCA